MALEKFQYLKLFENRADGVDVDLDLLFEFVGIFENLVAADVFKIADLHLLAVEVDVLFVDQIDFEHLRLIFVKGSAVADVGGGVVKAMADAQLGGIDPAWR